MKVLLRKKTGSVLQKKWLLRRDWQSVHVKPGSGQGVVWDIRAKSEDGAQKVAVWYPEVGIHATQVCKVTERLVEFEQREGVELCLITLSKVLVNRLGLLTENGTLSPGDAEVIILKGLGEGGVKDVLWYDVYTFDEQGLLDGWSLGWFSPDN